MGSEPTLEEWNLQHIALNQALLGVISSNIRMVWLDHQKAEWILHFVLKSEDATDREEVSDAATEFEALQDRAITCRVELVVKADALDWPAPPARVIFRRRD